MKRLLAIVASWILSASIFAAVLILRGDQIWRGFIDFFALLVFMGLPLLIIVPFLHFPIFRWVGRLVQTKEKRPYAYVLAGMMCSLPATFWPTFVFSDSIRELLAGRFSSFLRAVNPAVGWPFYLLYGVFGIFLGGWYAWTSGSARPTSDRSI